MSIDGEIREKFTVKGFSVGKSPNQNPQNYDGAHVRYQKEEFTIDLLIGSVRDRDDQVEIPAKFICKGLRIQRIVGLNPSTESEEPLAD
ncbi:MAG: hypothetical protein M1507_05485 [Candidatus Thermoplasmatota archaeon]|nr:hypothetical protein [Candidatus Thermoplasmatota archaeon]